jgi:hypothetical protein
VKREQETINLKAQKMMKGKVEPYVVLIMVKAMLTMVQATKQTVKIPQMIVPQETQLRE